MKQIGSFKNTNRPQKLEDASSEDITVKNKHAAE